MVRLGWGEGYEWIGLTSCLPLTPTKEVAAVFFFFLFFFQTVFFAYSFPALIYCGHFWGKKRRLYFLFLFNFTLFYFVLE